MTSAHTRGPHMAKKQSRTGKRTWKPEPEDAIRLAALRWFAIELERYSIEIYASDRAKYKAMEGVLRKALAELKRLGRPSGEKEEESCPDGYILCRDGLCAPMCDAEEA
jgi:hypothetical protein